MPTSAPPLFSADVLKKCALVALHLVAEEEKAEKMDVMPLIWGTNGKWVVQRVQCGRGNVCNDALRVIGLYGPGGKISLFLQDRELAKVAFSCHMALDMLCKEMHEAWWSGDATERPAVTARSAVLSPWTGCNS